MSLIEEEFSLIDKFRALFYIGNNYYQKGFFKLAFNVFISFKKLFEEKGRIEELEVKQNNEVTIKEKKVSDIIKEIKVYSKYERESQELINLFIRNNIDLVDNNNSKHLKILIMNEYLENEMNYVIELDRLLFELNNEKEDEKKVERKREKESY